MVTVTWCKKYKGHKPELLEEFVYLGHTRMKLHKSTTV